VTAPAITLRITYAGYAAVQADLVEMARGGVMVKVLDATGLELGTRVALELGLPSGASVRGDVGVLHVFPGLGVAVSVDAALVDQVRRDAAGKPAGDGGARHERVEPGGPASAPAARPRSPSAIGGSVEGLTNAEKVQVALHGNRDQRNAILRDPNRSLHPFVLKNPQVGVDDVLAMARNGQTSPELLELIAKRPEWLQRPQIAIALARNPKTPPDVAVRAVEFAPIDALRQIAKGSGAPPHVIQAARRKVVR
jgi:hypothetical protein